MYFNCNSCSYINITEENQTKLKEPHICTFYNERVYHNSRCNKVHHSYIYPCSKCVKDKYKNYKYEDPLPLEVIYKKGEMKNMLD